MLAKLLKKSTKETGNLYEKVACEYLQDKGLKLLTRNYYCQFGEIDLIMLDHDDLIFIEVRFRKQSSFSTAAGSITPAKQKKIMRTAEYFLADNKKYQHTNCRFDVIAIDESHDGHKHIDWIKNAFME